MVLRYKVINNQANHRRGGICFVLVCVYEVIEVNDFKNRRSLGQEAQLHMRFQCWVPEQKLLLSF